MSEVEVIVKIDTHTRIKNGSVVRELVRCEDCKYYEAVNNDDHGWCKMIDDYPTEISKRYDDDYCSKGKKP